MILTLFWYKKIEYGWYKGSGLFVYGKTLKNKY
jgi:hypothetical protein